LTQVGRAAHEVRDELRARAVRIDSGWNCTPSTGWVRCRIAIGRPSAVRALTSRTDGRLASSIASE